MPVWPFHNRWIDSLLQTIDELTNKYDMSTSHKKQYMRCMCVCSQHTTLQSRRRMTSPRADLCRHCIPLFTAVAQETWSLYPGVTSNIYCKSLWHRYIYHFGFKWVHLYHVCCRRILVRPLWLSRHAWRSYVLNRPSKQITYMEMSKVLYQLFVVFVFARPDPKPVILLHFIFNFW